MGHGKKDIVVFQRHTKEKAHSRVIIESEKVKAIESDLIIESAHFFPDEEPDETKGITVTVTKNPKLDIKVTTVDVLNELGSKNIHKPMGKYITIESPFLRNYDVEVHEGVMKILIKQLEILYPKKKKVETILIVGLGNAHISPDSLGPKVIEKILVTRQIDAKKEDIKSIQHKVAAITPGVLGVTGIETGETIQGIVKKIKPDLLIAIDALVAKNAHRLNATIQLSDTGIYPGGGIAKQRKRLPLNQDTLGIPVIAMGIPTVLDLSSLVHETFLALEKEDIISMGDEERMLTGHLIDEITVHLADIMGNLLVTPNDVDDVIERLSVLLANGINIWVHPKLEGTEFLPLTQ